MKISEYQQRLIAVTLMFLSMAIPMFIPLGLPISVSQETRDVFNFIESLNEGDNIFFSVDGSIATIAETGPPCVAAIQHLLDRGVNIVFFTTYAEGIICLTNYILPDVDTSNSEYGINYVNLGYFGGSETALKALATNIKDITGLDYYGTPLQELPLMEKVNSAEDIKLFVGVAGGLADGYIRQFWGPYNIMILVLARAANAPALYPYYMSGQLIFTVGIRGAAEYEILLKRPGKGLATTDVISLAHILVILGIISGNIVYLYQRWKKK